MHVQADAVKGDSGARAEYALFAAHQLLRPWFGVAGTQEKGDRRAGQGTGERGGTRVHVPAANRG